MLKPSLRRALLLALAAVLLLAACDSATPTNTPVIPTATLTALPTSTSLATATSAPPTSTTAPTSTALPPTSTEAPTVAPTTTTAPTNTTAPLPTVTTRPSNTAEPTATAEPPTATALPPTNTAVPPTNTAVPPTNTSVPPTNTSVPPTATEAPAETDTPEPEATSTPEPQATNTAAPEPTSTTAPAPPTATAPPVPVTADLIVSVPPGKKMVALTFDAGAGRGRVADILATFRQYGVHITFFLTGKWAEENPDMVRAIVADGHEIANHSYSHPDFTTLSDAEMLDQLEHCEQLVQEIAGVTSKPYFRPPYGAYNRHVLNFVAAQGYQSIYWTLDSLDSVGQPKSKEFIIKRITENNLEMDGAIVLQHMAADGSADALPTVIERLQARGLKIVTMGELLR